MNKKALFSTLLFATKWIVGIFLHSTFSYMIASNPVPCEELNTAQIFLLAFFVMLPIVYGILFLVYALCREIFLMFKRY